MVRGPVLGVTNLHHHHRPLGAEKGAFRVGERKLHLPRIDVHVCSRGNSECEWRVRSVGEDGELEADVLLELNADGIGFFQESSGAKELIL